MYASSRVLAPSAYSSATPASMRPAAQEMPDGASASAMVVTRLLPTRTDGPDQAGSAGGSTPGTSITWRRIWAR